MRYWEDNIFFGGYEIPGFQYSKKCYEKYFLSSFDKYRMCIGGEVEMGICIVLLSAGE